MRPIQPALQGTYRYGRSLAGQLDPFKIEPNDRIEVRGSRVTYNGQPAIIASEIKKGNETLALSDSNGYPAWSGSRRRTG